MEILTEELKETAPSRIAFVSFTRKGTYEGAKRAVDLLGLREEDLPYFRTLHSIAFRECRFSRYDMVSRTDYREFSKLMGMNFTGYYTEDLFGEDDKYLFAHFLRRNNTKAADIVEEGMSESKLIEVALNFERYKKENAVTDFTDVIEQFVAKNTPLPIDVAIVDEAQDLTSLQWQMCEVAFRNCKKLYIAGDDDQAIYEWSGADVSKFLVLARTADEIQVLGKSWRLRKEILAEAKGISTMISDRVDKRFDPVGAGGVVSVYNSLDEIEITAGESWYFLNRNNYFLSSIREFLRKKIKVFIDKEALSYDPKHVEAIKVYEVARRRGSLADVETIKLRSFLNKGYDLKKPWFESLNFEVDQSAYYRDLIRTKASLEDRSITVSTIHGVKGGEADNVVLTMDFTKSVKESIMKRPDAELRCLYVAVTRAKKGLHIVHSATKNGYDSFIKIGG
jgi:DNA helicase-2/ATP-dependent DNA helicase PcrA